MLTDKPKRKRTPRRYHKIILLLVLLAGISGALLYFNQSHSGRQFTKPKTPITAENAKQVELIGRLDMRIDADFVETKFSADSGLLMVTSTDGASIWDTKTGEQIRHFQLESPCAMYATDADCPDWKRGSFYAYILSPDMKWLYTKLVFEDRLGSTEPALWDFETGQKVRGFDSNFSIYSETPFSADGTMLLFTDNRKTCSGVCAYNLLTGESVTLIPNINQMDWYDENRIFGVDIIGDMLYHSRNHAISAVNVKTGATTQLLTGTDVAMYMDISPDGTWAALLNPLINNQIQVWNLPTKQKTVEIPGADYNRISFTPNSDRMIVGNGGVQVWDLQTGRMLSKLDEQFAAMSPDASLIITLSYNTLMFWNWQTGQVVHSIYVDPVYVSPHTQPGWHDAGHEQRRYLRHSRKLTLQFPRTPAVK